MRGILTIVILAAAFSAGSVTAFKAISDRAERIEASAAHDQMDRVAFSGRYAPKIEAERP